ncbi:2-hydroxychromene-2-carboxylate isomerase [Ferrovibrio sp.]|uniref:2-hydroxychromene-2-carboxylate isomerase n=1 Tax=Ferrovibrio sp. TaxID=1917215 RepID=UPI003D0BC1BE
MSQQPPLDFYFDFISPFGYFASLRIDELAVKHGRSTTWHPMLLGVSVLKVMGLKPLLDTPLKGPYIERSVERYRSLHGITMKRQPRDEFMNPLPPARAYYWLFDQDAALAKRAARAIYRAYWRDGRDMGQPDQLCAVLAPLGIDSDALREALADPRVAQRLRDEVEASMQRGVFGSPFVIADGEPFWGNDSLDLLDLWLTKGGW